MDCFDSHPEVLEQLLEVIFSPSSVVMPLIGGESHLGDSGCHRIVLEPAAVFSSMEHLPAAEMAE